MNLTKKIAAASALLLAMTSAVSMLSMSQTVYAAESTAGYADAVAELVNAERSAAGLAPVQVVPVLNAAAEKRSQEITINFSHTRPDGSSCFTVLEDFGVQYRTSGENIAYGYASPEAVMDGWMHSEGHRANILNANFEYIGVGVVEYGGLLYWTQTFTGGAELADAYSPSAGQPDKTETVEPTRPVKPSETVEVPVTVTKPSVPDTSVPCIGDSCPAICTDGNCSPNLNTFCIGGNCLNSSCPMIFTLPGCTDGTCVLPSECTASQLLGLLNCR